MKKDMQLLINDQCESHYTEMMDEVLSEIGRLRSCNATVYESDNYYVLRSYRTIVAFIDKRTGIGYDVLRWVFEYTSTSAQHISKFFKDYGFGKWGCDTVFTERIIK